MNPDPRTEQNLREMLANRPAASPSGEVRDSVLAAAAATTCDRRTRRIRPIYKIAAGLIAVAAVSVWVLLFPTVPKETHASIDNRQSDLNPFAEVDRDLANLQGRVTQMRTEIKPSRTADPSATRRLLSKAEQLRKELQDTALKGTSES